MSPTTPVDPQLTALLATAYRLGLAAGRAGGGMGGGGGPIALAAGHGPQVGAQIPMPATASGGAGGGDATPFDGHHLSVDGGGGDAHSLAQLATQQNIAATLRDDAMRDALAQSEQRRQQLEVARWAQLASMRGTPTRSWLADTAGLPFRV